jgi:hypothetical protein
MLPTVPSATNTGFVLLTGLELSQLIPVGLVVPATGGVPAELVSAAPTTNVAVSDVAVLQL